MSYAIKDSFNLSLQRCRSKPHSTFLAQNRSRHPTHVSIHPRGIHYKSGGRGSDKIAPDRQISSSFALGGSPAPRAGPDSEVGVTSKATIFLQNACTNRVRFEPCTAADAATVGQCGGSQPCRRRRGPTRLPPVDGPSRGSRHEHTNVKLRKSPPQACCSCTG